MFNIQALIRNILQFIFEYTDYTCIIYSLLILLFFNWSLHTDCLYFTAAPVNYIRFNIITQLFLHW